MMPYCGCAAKNEMVNYLLCYNGNPDHLAEYCAVGMRQSFWNGGSTILVLLRKNHSINNYIFIALLTGTNTIKSKAFL